MNANQINWGPDDTAQVNVLEVVYRLLRGKIILTVLLAFVFGVLGGVLGYLAKSPEYRSTGQIRIQPSLPKVLFQTEQSTATQMFSSFVSSQAEFIKRGRVIDRALDSDEWRAVEHLSDIRTALDVQERLDVRVDRRAQEVIYISFSDENPKVPVELVQAIMDSYIEQYGKEGSIDNPEIRGMLNTRLKTLESDRDYIDTQISDIAGKYRTENLQPLVDNALHTIKLLEDQLKAVEEQQLQYQQFRQSNSEGSSEPMSAEEAGESDPMIAGLLTRHTELVDARDELMISEGLRAEHRDVRRLTAMIDGNQQRIATRLEELQSGEKQVVLKDAQGMPLPSEEALERSVMRLNAKIRDAEAQSEDLFRDSVRVGMLRAERAKKQESIAQVTQRLDQIETESKVEDMEHVTGKISITGEPVEASSPTSDPRKKLAFLGFVGMGSLPVGVILAIGFFSHKIQYSDDDILGKAGAGIVGILPDLGNGFADNDIASASAFAVHQTRSQLQIKSNPGDSMVYGVTSPAPQDGKTSFIIAMGLSFAESGERTLLVDMDFIGRGLSVHFGYPDAPSYAELLDTVDDIDSLICDTDFEGLSMLPAGFGDDERVSRLSPQTVGGLIEHLREQYDTVLIDTGPILGSVEAAFVSPQADGVILVVGRGQHRPLVKKAIDQIHSVNGSIIATIFNRASMHELRQSSSSMSVHFSRQISRQQDAVGQGKSLWGGPVAGALVNSKNAKAGSGSKESKAS